MLDFLLNDLYYLWTKEAIITIMKDIIKLCWISDSLRVILLGKCFQNLM